MLPAFGLYTHIRANRRKSVALVVGLFFLIYALTFAFGLLFRAWQIPPGSGVPVEVYLWPAAWDFLWLSPFVTAGTALWVWVASCFHQGIIDRMTGSAGIGREDDPRLYNLLENLCISRGLAVPRLKVMETGALNAFATGLNEKQYAVTVTRGLLEALDDAELEAVLGHELTHIRNEDVRMMVTATIIVGVFSFFGELFLRSFSVISRMDSSSGSGRSDSKKGGGFLLILLVLLIALVLVTVARALSLVIRAALSRSREFLADAGAVELTKNPDAMISALVKISGASELEGAPSGIMAMCVDNPRSGFFNLFATHPAIEDRIDALVRYAGGSLPRPEAAEPEAETPLRGDRANPPAAAWERFRTTALYARHPPRPVGFADSTSPSRGEVSGPASQSRPPWPRGRPHRGSLRR